MVHGWVGGWVGEWVGYLLEASSVDAFGDNDDFGLGGEVGGLKAVLLGGWVSLCG